MKIHHLIVFLFTGAILLGLATGVFIPADQYKTIFVRLDQNWDRIPESYAAASMSKSTILVLLAVGVIGALGVNRKKKKTKSGWRSNASDRASHQPKVNTDRRRDQP